MPDDIELRAALELFEAAPCGYLFTQPDGTITKVNQTFLNWTGYSRADLVGRRCFQELLSVPAKIFYETHFSPLLRMQGYVKEITVDIIGANDRVLPALVNSVVQHDDAGGPAFIRTTVFDIRERRRYERELLAERRKAERLASAIDNTTDAIVIVSSDLTIETWNGGAQELFGYTGQEALGRNIRDLIVPEDLLQKFDSQVAALKTGQAIHDETFRRNRSGELIPVSITTSPQIEPPDEFMGFSTIMRDVRDRRKAEEALLVRRDMELANFLAHEINNPLQAATNCLSLLSHDKHSEYAELAEKQLERVAGVVLDLTRLTGSKKNSR